jgi:SAM-dependent methyltransferase
MKKVDFDDFAGGYDALLRQQTSFFADDESYFARYKVSTARHVVQRRPKRVLELGCGTGRNIPFLREAFPGSVVMGSDVSEKSLEVARAANPQVHFWKEGESLEERSGFDLIFVAGVFHHVAPGERSSLATSIAQRLNPDGTALVFEHNPFNPVTRRIVSQCPYDEGVILLRARELRRHLRAAGLRRQRQGYALFFPPTWRPLLSLEKHLSWLPLGGQYWVAADRA